MANKLIVYCLLSIVGAGNSVKRGYKFFCESFIHDYQVLQNEKEFLIKARCHRSQRRNEPPHSISITLQKNSVLSAVCSCAAGESLCCHALACLYCTAHFSNLQLTRVPPDVTCTMRLQSWHHPRSEGFQHPSIQKIIIQNPISKSSRTVQSTLHKPGNIPSWEKFKIFNDHNVQISTIIPPNLSTLNISTRFGEVPFGSPLSYQQLSDSYGCSDFPNIPCSSLSTSVAVVLTKEQQKMIKKLSLTEENSQNIESVTRNQSCCPTWHQQRRFRLTASKFGRICKRTANFDTLAANLLTGKSVQTAAMKRGLQMEPEAVKIYEDVKKCQCFPCGLVISSTCPWLGCSPDRRVYDPSGDCELCYGLLEVKCPVSDSFERVGCLYKNDDGEWALKKNHDYYYQIMGCLGITGIKWCDIIILLPSGACFIDRIYFDEIFFQDMQQRLDVFFYNFFINALISL